MSLNDPEGMYMGWSIDQWYRNYLDTMEFSRSRKEEKRKMKCSLAVSKEMYILFN